MNEAAASRDLPGLTPSRRRSSACLSDKTLDALLLEELDGPSTANARAHIADCVDCEKAHAAMRTESTGFCARLRFSAALDSLVEHSRLDPTTAPSFWQTLWPRRLVWATGFAAATAALVVGLPAGTENRMKGGFSLSTYVQKHGATNGSLWIDGPVSPGDRIQFQVTSNTPGHLAILAIDDAAQISVYYPPGPVAVPIGVGSNQPLSTAVVLDDTLGTETVIALRCQSAEKTADLIEFARRAVTSSQKNGQTASSVGALGTGCVEYRLTLTKAR
jgi:hypothetical protein